MKENMSAYITEENISAYEKARMCRVGGEYA